MGGYQTASPNVGHAKVELWDGSSWTETTEINTGRYRVAGSGIQTSSLVFAVKQGPAPTKQAKTESMEWNFLDRVK